MSRTTAFMAAFVATAALMVLLPATSPALATDAPIALRPAKPAPAIASGRVTHRHHVAFHSRPVPAGLGCTGLWCGRQFVLMVGIGY